VTFPVDTSPAQNLISPNGQLLFADIFAVPGSTAAQGNTLAPFQIQADGTLKLAPGGNIGTPTNPPLLLGADTNPNLPIVYAGLTGAGQLATFTYLPDGQLTFIGTSPVQGAAPCWVAVSPNGKYLYTGDTGTDSVGVFSLADPLHPLEIQEFALGGPHAPPGSPPGTLQANVFQVAVSPDGHTVYAVSQSTNPTGSFPEGNQLHILSVASDGTLSEPNGPILLGNAGVPGDAHPQGIAVVAGRGHHHHRPDDGGDRDSGTHIGGTNLLDSVFAANAASGSSSVTNSVAVADSALTDLVNALLHLSHESGSGG
jgi:DNA-binding beta-propeller fold protein YncE